MPYTWPVTADEVDAELNLGADTSQDAELAGYVDAVTRVIERRVGDITNATYTETHDGGDVSIYLRHRPVVSVASITEVVGSVTYTLTLQPPGSSTDAWGFSLDDPANGKIVRRSAAGQPWRFTAGVGNITVTYTAGRAGVPLANMRLAALQLIQHMWSATQRGNSSGRPVPGGEAEPAGMDILAGQYLPIVEELLMPDLQIPTVA